MKAVQALLILWIGFNAWLFIKSCIAVIKENCDATGE